MDESLNRAIDQMLTRIEGALYLRLILQPCMAAFIAVRAGLYDAHPARPPYLRAVFSQPAERKFLVRSGSKDLALVFTLAFVLDTLYQIVVFRWFYPVQALIVAFVLAILPYIAIRGSVARFAATRHGTAGHVKGVHFRCL